jgi:hypothetical protein
LSLSGDSSEQLKLRCHAHPAPDIGAPDIAPVVAPTRDIVTVR